MKLVATVMIGSTAAAVCLASVPSEPTLGPAAGVQEPPAPVTTVKPLRDALERVREKTGVPGIAAAVTRDGKVIGVGVCGVREIGKPSAIEPGDSFLIGSCTKAMTRMLLLRMADAGEVRFEATLGELLPDVPMREEYRKVTVSNLAQHMAGLPAYTRITPTETPIVFEVKGTPNEKRSQFAAHLLMEAPVALPGSRFVYSNASYALLGNLAERRGGKPWEELMVDRVFTPLKMAGVTFGRPKGGPDKPVPIGHERTPGGFEPARRGPPVAGLFAPAGAVCLPIGEFAKFAAMEAELDGGHAAGFVGKETAARMPGLLPADMAKGEGQPFFGGEGTFTAAFATWPSKHISVVVCTNAGESDEICTEVIRAVLSECAPDILLALPNAGGKQRRGIQIRSEPGGQVIVADVVPGSPAEKLEFQKDDEIKAIDGKSASDLSREEMVDAVRRSGTRITLLRAGRSIEVIVP